MIANIDIADKSYGDKILYSGLEFNLNAHEKVGLIGRNGTGKTTLFNILTGADTDYAGEVTFRKNLVVIDSRQEHHGYEDTPILEYILDDLPDYAKLKHILDTYPETMGSSMKKMEEYSEVLERFNVLGYFSVEEEIERSLQDYQIDADKIKGTIGQLSGGQKRFIELVKVQHARADLALIDEPTNHMDFVAKERFLDWFKATKEAVVVITHDRDVLHHVDRIVEIRDGRAFNFKGNYDDYLKTNATKITAQVNEFTINQRRISNLKEDIVRFRRMKERARDPGTIHRFKTLEERAKKERAELEKMDKPSFWIDRESVDNLNTKMSKAYEEHKAKNIVIRTRTKATKSSNLLVDVSKLSLGYGEPLFENVGFQLREGEKLRLHGRNGAGKTTLIKAILATAANTQPESTIFGGVIDTLRELKIGIYEQEISSKYLDMPLARAIEHSFMAKDVKIGDEKVKQLLGDYLFNPNTDGEVPISRLSGGQKARFQLMNMLANDPVLLILDEPTNHLDLPSIEELEDALKQYHGAIIYVSHDSYFVKNIGGEQLSIGQ
jgi:ATPase subunit of ABC transporter with duplicated ATPase domains